MAKETIGDLVIRLRAQGINVTERQLRRLEGQSNRTGASLGSMVAAVGGIYALGRAFGAVIGVGKEFATSQSNLAAILGTSRENLGSLNASARELGATTKFTAAEVVGLQTEFAKLGFTTQEVENAQAATLALAGATGVDLAVAAEQAGQMVNAFGLGAEQTGRVVNVMAASFSSSALDMEKFSNSMVYVSAVANQAGIPIEATTGILGKLADVGIDGSIAGTALRRIFLEMGNEASKLSKKVGFAVKSEEDLFNALKKLNAMGLSTAEMEDLVGKRAISAFSNMLKFADSSEELTRQITGTNKALEMQEEQLNNLQGDLDIMNSAATEFSISLFQELEPALRAVVQGITELIGHFDVQALKSYATAIGIVTASYVALNTQAVIATIGVKNLKRALLTSGIGLAIVAVGELVDKLGFFSDDESDKVYKGVRKISSGFSDDLTPGIDDSIEKLDEFIEKTDESIVKNAVKSLMINIKPVDLFDFNKPGESATLIQQALSEVFKNVTVPKLNVVEDEPDVIQGEDEPAELTKEQKKQIKQLKAYTEQFNELTLEQKEKELLLEKEKMEEIAKLQLEGKEATDAQLLAIEQVFQKKKELLNKKEEEAERARINAKITQYSQLANSIAGIWQITGKNAELVTNLQYFEAIANTYTAATAALKNAGGAPQGLIPMAITIAQGLAQVAQIAKARDNARSAAQTDIAAAYGASFITNGPTRLLVGDNPGGQEQVNVTPISSPNMFGDEMSQGSSVTINVQGNVLTKDYVEGELIDALNEAIRKGNVITT